MSSIHSVLCMTQAHCHFGFPRYGSSLKGNECSFLHNVAWEGIILEESKLVLWFWPLGYRIWEIIFNLLITLRVVIITSSPSSWPKLSWSAPIISITTVCPLFHRMSQYLVPFALYQQKSSRIQFLGIFSMF